jgi:tRNA modification GTPase
VIPPDTIAAIATPAGRGAVGIIRVSGSEVPRVAGALLGALPPPRVARLAGFLADDGGSLDQGLAVYFPAPASFTGEHVLELQGHGGAQVMNLVLARLLQLGCRLARPGEFSERAFLNGKLDIAQAEAVADLIDAGSSAAARAAVRSLQGAFSARVHDLQAQLTALRTFVEAAIDFPDEEIDFLTDTALDDRVSRLCETFDSITAAAKQGVLLRDGLTLVLAGKPNAGKSSLLNRLVGDDVAIVSDTPGTTRDVLRHALHLDGLPVNLIDTAGLRIAADHVEDEGIRRARVEIARADRILYVCDAASPAELDDLPSSVPLTLIINKIDLVGMTAHLEEGSPARVFVSARTGEGIELLRSHLKARAGYLGAESSTLSARSRHLVALAQAEALVRHAAASWKQGHRVELCAEDLRLAQRALGEILGEFTSDDLLGEIFGSFCVGK